MPPKASSRDAPSPRLPTLGRWGSFPYVLGKRIGPMRLDSRGRSRENPATAQEIRVALHGLDAALLIPLRPQGALGAFLCLGPKRSGDVYTPTDLSLLASVAHHASEELSC